MTAVDVITPKFRRGAGKMLQIARHRVARWFHFPAAELRRQRFQGLQPHPFPRASAREIVAGKEGRREQPA